MNVARAHVAHIALLACTSGSILSLNGRYEMTLHIQDPETDTLVREVARLRGEEVTEAIKSVFDAELQRQKAKIPLYERLRPLIDEIAALPKSGLKADKAFFDDMWGQGDD